MKILGIRIIPMATVIAIGVLIDTSVAGPPEDARARAQETMKSAVAPQLQLVVELRDGSRVIGVPSIESLPVRTSFAKVTLPLKQITTVEFGEDRQIAKVNCANGDIIQGSLDINAISLKTSFNTVSLQPKDIVRITVQGGTGASTLIGPIKKGLVLYYSFDKDEGKAVTDQSGKGSDGENHGSKWTSRGAVGGALSFEGEGESVSFPFNDFPLGRSPRTLAAWVYQDNLDHRHYVVGYGACSRGDEYRLSLNEFSRGQISIETYMGGWHAGATLSAKKWYHLAVTFDGDGVPKFYINGEVSQAHGWMSPAINTRSGEGTIGDRGNCERGHTFEGRIDEVMIWDRALNGSEIKSLVSRRIAHGD